MLVTVFVPAATVFSVCIRIKCFILRLKPLLPHLFPRLILDLNVISSKLMFLTVFDVTKHIHLLLNPLNAELNPVCYLLALLGAHHLLHVSRIRVKLLAFSFTFTSV